MVSASQGQTLSGIGARVYTAHRGWLGVVTGISAASTGTILVLYSKYYRHLLKVETDNDTLVVNS